MTRFFLGRFSLALAGLLAARALPAADTLPLAGVSPVKSGLLESNVVYLRVSEVTAQLPDEIGAAVNSLSATNKCAGTVLDLRYAGGDDSGAVEATAHWFSAGKLPLAILVNADTHGAAAELAAALRSERAGLIFGSAAADVKPDIVVTMRPDDEKVFWNNPYASTNEAIAPPDTNHFLPYVDHTSEADLVRAKIKDGEEGEDFPLARATAPPRHVIRDPVLARAVDLIEGLAVMRKSHS
ncbi:MAG: hypothetical protein ABSE16_17945 [Verrucomicrobiota bacterium]|jgi:hypothetical protein